MGVAGMVSGLKKYDRCDPIDTDFNMVVSSPTMVMVAGVLFKKVKLEPLATDVVLGVKALSLNSI